jgi:His/Glu/Gln/Arg/opine family amino acid ABC transporter permease subunit
VSGWAVFADPAIWLFLLGGLWVTLQISAVVIVVSFCCGTLLALACIAPWRLPRRAALTYVHVVRGIPVYLFMLVVYFGGSRLGLKGDVSVSVAVALTVYTTAYISEIVRGGVLSVAAGQLDAARSLGAFRYVVFPQALRAVVPPLILQYIVAINGTSIGAVIGLDELLHRSVILYNGHQNPIETLLVAGSMYFVVLFTLSRLARRFELSRLGAQSGPRQRMWWMPRLARLGAGPRSQSVLSR